MPTSSVDPGRNRLLACLAAADFAALARHLERIPLAQGAILQEEDVAVEWVYFPLSGAVSLLAVTGSGDAVETAIVGCEAAVGLFAEFGPWRASTRAVVQAPGTAERIPLPLFKAVVDQSEPIRGLMLRCKETLTAQKAR
jgi:CRP-like cAMP-binding protein